MDREPDRQRTFKPGQRVVVTGNGTTGTGNIVGSGDGLYTVDLDGIGDVTVNPSRLEPAPAAQTRMPLDRDDRLALHRRFKMLESTLANMEAGVPAMRRELERLREELLPEFARAA